MKVEKAASAVDPGILERKYDTHRKEDMAIRSISGLELRGGNELNPLLVVEVFPRRSSFSCLQKTRRVRE
jgi:hypothetical protein